MGGRRCYLASLPLGYLHILCANKRKQAALRLVDGRQRTTPSCSRPATSFFRILNKRRRLLNQRREKSKSKRTVLTYCQLLYQGSEGEEISYSHSMDMHAFRMKMDKLALEPGTDEIQGKHITGHSTEGRDMTAT
uniref:Uncharacterized protein n=1 Tax=Tanacetum cinerariifolium TaxID=118510 RepID=A0A6L2KPU4_TANCI|nr:hypothetical protein [Tanacetum cinerariifolium]